MRCIECDVGDLFVQTTFNEGNIVQRERKCRYCGQRFLTTEKITAQCKPVYGRKEKWQKERVK